MSTAKTPDRDGLQLLQRSPASAILRLLQRNGPQTAKQLQAALGVRSLNAVREQLVSLSAADLIDATAVRQPAGRPAYVYALSDKAQALFPKGYDVLARLLLEEIAAQEGPERLRSILQGVSVRLAAELGDHTEQQTLQERLDQIVYAFDQRGTPLRVEEDADTIVLHEHSCPYFNVAQVTDEVCYVEQQMLEQMLGRNVVLTQRMIDGHAGCCFVIRKHAQPSDDTPINDPTRTQ